MRWPSEIQHRSPCGQVVSNSRVEPFLLWIWRRRTRVLVASGANLSGIVRRRAAEGPLEPQFGHEGFYSMLTEDLEFTK